MKMETLIHLKWFQISPANKPVMSWRQEQRMNLLHPFIVDLYGFKIFVKNPEMRASLYKRIFK